MKLLQELLGKRPKMIFIISQDTYFSNPGLLISLQIDKTYASIVCCKLEPVYSQSPSFVKNEQTTTDSTANQVHYLFGGNPGRTCLPKLRLDDFWRLSLIKPSHSQLLQRCKVLIRTFRYQELAMTESLTALHYLQTALSEIIDHEDQEQTKEFQTVVWKNWRAVSAIKISVINITDTSLLCVNRLHIDSWNNHKLPADRINLTNQFSSSEWDWLDNGWKSCQFSNNLNDFPAHVNSKLFCCWQLFSHSRLYADDDTIRHYRLSVEHAFYLWEVFLRDSDKSAPNFSHIASDEMLEHCSFLASLANTAGDDKPSL
ncbi:Muskelin 1, intracellular mediator containing kelch motif [Homalodisca vitripennis]|nr:Muskelin 1, intracellular mediator containing kelch motif [Homalodisca vitripennis]